VQALDEHTLVVELEEPIGYFLQLLGRTTFPVPRHVVEAHGEAWAEVGDIVTNGPFRLESWQRGQSMTLVRNPEYRGRFTGNVQQIERALEWSAAQELYEADNLDVSDLRFFPPPEVDRARQRHAGEYLVQSNMKLFANFCQPGGRGGGRYPPFAAFGDCTGGAGWRAGALPIGPG
jgi:oligopeptide transport system substrate-binding protein